MQTSRRFLVFLDRGCGLWGVPLAGLVLVTEGGVSPCRKPPRIKDTLALCEWCCYCLNRAARTAAADRCSNDFTD